MVYINNFCDKIYVINLFDKEERWKKVSKQFKKKNINIERFVAVDGRCKNQSKEACLSKLKTFELLYDIKISNKNKKPIEELIPASSLTIGTIMILRNMVKHKLKRIMICEDDIVLGRNFEENFKRGIKEINKTSYKDKWDLLYVGCGNRCGNSGIGTEKTKENRYLNTVSQFIDQDIYVNNKLDIRTISDNSKSISSHIVIPENAGGSWCYIYSLKGAKKMLKLIGNDAGNHVDQIYQNLPNYGGMKVLAFDPPIVWHEEGAIRRDTDIPWKM